MSTSYSSEGKRQVWLIPIVDEGVGVQVKLQAWEHVPYLSASEVVIHYEEALYQVYACKCMHLPNV